MPLRIATTTAVAILLAIALNSIGFVRAAIQGPKPLGISRGLMAECPGVEKDARISPTMLPLLQLVWHRVDENGELLKKIFPIKSAAASIAKEKHVDLKKNKTLMFCGGYLDTTLWVHNRLAAASYSKRGYNVFLMEAFSFLMRDYAKAARLAKAIGREIGGFLANLTAYGLDASNLEFVGLSLGTHISGFAAKRFYTLTGKKPSRITALDPSGPCFRYVPPHLRLDSTDAHHVDVIHTNIDGFGIAEPLGHVDFYVNGGEYQPSDLAPMPCLIICSHGKSFVYWWVSLEQPKKFIALKCDSVQDARFANCYKNTQTNVIGFETDFAKPGIYYLATGNVFPYFLGKEGLKPENEIFAKLLARGNENDVMEY